ncbi:MAG: DUF6069 family protein [Pseudoclavibacter sp.]
MTTISKPDYRVGTAIAISALIVAVAGSAVNALVALGAVALGASVAGGLQPIAYISLTVVSGIGGAIGWHLINRRAKRPAQVLRWLVPTFFVVSLVPTLAVGFDMGWLVAGALMLMHLTTAVVAVLSYRRLMPLRA